MAPGTLPGMKPSIGRIVHVTGPAASANGVDIAPAIITRVWSDTMLNVTVFPDAATPRPATSVKLVEDEATASDINAQAEHPQNLAYWPPRV